MAKVVGAKPSEVVIMNSLTTNLHLMMVSFYQPSKNKYKILIERDAFPSDKYAVESQLKYHGYCEKKGLIQWKPREGEELCRIVAPIIINAISSPCSCIICSKSSIQVNCIH